MRKRQALVVALMLGVWMGGIGMAEENEKALFSFEEKRLPENCTQNQIDASMVQRDGKWAIKGIFHPADYPNAFFSAPPEGWDWSGYAGVSVDLFNPGDVAVVASMRVDNEGADGYKNCNTSSTTVPPGETSALRVYFRTEKKGVLWGMRGLPKSGPLGFGGEIDPSRIVAFQVFLDHPTETHTLLLDNVKLFGDSGAVAMPFVDRFGQYGHSDWPGKLKDEKEFAERLRKEEEDLKSRPEVKDRDQVGGWAKGPQLEGTGWFRTENIDGTWWFVTPEAHLFFSMGVDCVGTWEKTFVQGREEWFEWLPENEGPFGFLYSYQKGAHSMADPIAGEGMTFSFYGANLVRKYGADWPNKWRDSAYARLRSWGFNTIANWSQQDVLEKSPMPFVVSLGIAGEFRNIEGATGYWGRMKDVFDPNFPAGVAKSVAHIGASYAQNPLCIGYFADNELSWETIQKGVLISPPDQPARRALVERLQAKYSSIDALNAAWGVKVPDWDSLKAPDSLNDASREDLDGFAYEFAKRYFEAIRDGIKTHAPHQLYLGCRFASAPPPVVRACADVADVVSFNLYRPSIRCEDFSGEKDLGKPLIIGEFHFGALDRGMFHTGLVPTRDQKARAESYSKYLQSVADCPSFVGCHWFQYIDEPTTGRWFDGENYNIGFVNVTDSAYPELVEAAREVHREIYSRRFRGAKSR